MAEILKGCPHCGANPLTTVRTHINDKLGTCWVECDEIDMGCGARSGDKPTYREAVAAWNRRYKSHRLADSTWIYILKAVFALALMTIGVALVVLALSAGPK